MIKGAYCKLFHNHLSIYASEFYRIGDFCMVFNEEINISKPEYVIDEKAVETQPPRQGIPSTSPVVLNKPLEVKKEPNENVQKNVPNSNRKLEVVRRMHTNFMSEKKPNYDKINRARAEAQQRQRGIFKPSNYLQRRQPIAAPQAPMPKKIKQYSPIKPPQPMQPLLEARPTSAKKMRVSHHAPDIVRENTGVLSRRINDLRHIFHK